MDTCGPQMDEASLRALPVPTLYEFEKFYLSLPPIIERLQASSEAQAEVTLLRSNTNFLPGEEIQIRVDMRNGKGEMFHRGGDDIRVWFFNDSKTRRVAAHVRDLNNGSYLGTGDIPWPGSFNVGVTLAHSSAFIRLMIQIHLQLKATSGSSGMFRSPKDGVDEATMCSFSSTVPFYTSDEICNLTDANGSPWYCGKPIKKQLSCSDFRGTRQMPKIETWKLPVSPIELEELERTSTSPRVRYITKFKTEGSSNFQTSLKLTVQPGSLKQPTLTCNKLPAAETWTKQEPVGYLTKRKWSFKSCQSARTSDCFKNLRLFVVGDSNARNHYNALCGATHSVNKMNQTIKV